MKTYNPTIDWWNHTIRMNGCRCIAITLPKLNRENATLGQGNELCAATQEPDDEAQVDELKHIPAEYSEYLDVFREKTGKEALPAHQPGIDHTIPLESRKEVPWGPIYQLNTNQLGMLKRYIDKMLAKGHIRESTSPAGSGVLLVPKKKGDD